MAIPKPRIRLTIGAKLISLIAALLMGSVLTLVWVATRMFIEDNTALIQQTNADTAASLATQMRGQFIELTDKMRVLGTIQMQEQTSADARAQITREFFTKDKDFLGVFLYRAGETPTVIARTMSPEMAPLGDADGEKALATTAGDKDFLLPQVAKGEVQITSLKLADGSPAVAVAVPFIESASEAGTFTHTLTALLRQSKFVKAFSESDIVTSFMVDRKGKLLAHPDAARVAAGENVSQLGIVKQLLEGKFNNGQTRYLDPQSSEAKLGAYRVVGFGGLGVVAEVAEAKAFEAAKRVEYRAMLLAGIILCISFFAGYLYSGTITWPIKQLVVASHKIAEGDFHINLKPRGQDEVAHLSLAFNEMAKGLEERDRVKETFNKFHNKEIAEKLLSGEVKLGGERREATIFFSDVRGFTGMSESMEPEQVVEMLNEYMTRMVSIIRAHNGIVDKYVGDAIMAIWGVPIEKPDDTLNAVKACIAMRQDLAKLNELRISRGQPVLKIGMGLNRGFVIAGNIGSVEKMEYTVIGDSVNTASRMESMTKEYGTDLLIPQKVREVVADKFIWEQAKSARVKGKTEEIQVFKVKGYIDEHGNPLIVETPYSSYKAEKSDKGVHDDKHPAPPAGHAQESAPPEILAPGVASAQKLDAMPSADELLTQIKTPVVYYFNVENEVFGPFTVDEIRDGLLTKELSGAMLVHHSPQGPWVRLDKKPEFQMFFQSAA